MPGFDKTGPVGQGAQTGRKMGKCNPNSNFQDLVGYNAANEGFGLGRQRRCGRKNGFQAGSGKGQGGMRRRNFSQS